MSPSGAEFIRQIKNQIAQTESDYDPITGLWSWDGTYSFDPPRRGDE